MSIYYVISCSYLWVTIIFIWVYLKPAYKNLGFKTLLGLGFLHTLYPSTSAWVYR